MQGGVGDYTSHLALALSRLGIEASVLTSKRANLIPKAIDVFQDVEPIIDDWSLLHWRKVLDVVSKHRPDVLHIQYQTAGYGMHTAINLLPIRLRAMRGRPLIFVTFHDLKVPYLFPKAGPIRRLPGYLLARYSDGVVATNSEDYLSLGGDAPKEGRLKTTPEAFSLRDPSAQSELVISRFCGRPLFAIPIGSNIPKSPPVGYNREAWRRRLGVGDGDLLLAYFGFLNKSKGVDILLRAFEELVRTGFKVRLLMVGGTYGDSDPTNLVYGQHIQRQVETSLYRSRVMWTGFTSREEVSANLLASDVCVLPFNEGASMRHGSLMAAIVHELPIITTGLPGQRLHHPAFPDVSRAVKLVPPRDAEALARAIIEVGESATARSELSKAAASIASAFDWNVIGNAHVEAYRSLRGA